MAAQLQNYWIYKMPDGRLVHAYENKPGEWVFWPMSGNDIVSGDMSYWLDPAGKILYGMKVLCEFSELEDTGLIFDVHQGEVRQRE